tara:strand:- start:575 stop:1705 length:1131 start_codon:yes stop_codon:yes gene_type:complete
MKNKFLIPKDTFALEKTDHKKFLKTVNSIIDKGAFINGNILKKLESKFSKYIKTKHSIGFSNATNAISAVANILSSIDKNQEIIIPAYSPIPVSMALLNINKTIRYVDVDEQTMLASSNDIKNKINKKTKIIMPVHLFGNVFNILALKKEIQKNNIFIIEDSSQAHGSKLDKHKAGSLGHASIFSFYPTKNLGAFGDGGIITTNSKTISNKLNLYRNYGLHKTKDKIMLNGSNFRMDEIQSEVISLKLKHLDRENNKRLRLSKIYYENLNNIPVKFQLIEENVKSNFHVFIILVPSKLRDKMFNFLINNKIQASIYYKFLLPQITGEIKSKIILKNNYPNSYKLMKTNIALPIHSNLTENNILYVCQVIQRFFKKI